jgi:mono/diheme cytochrome c family protein
MLSKPVGLAAAVLSAVTLAFACSPPVTDLGAGIDPTTPRDSGKDKGTGQVTTKNGLPCEVNEILAKNCQTCHGAETKSGASTPLVSYDDLQQEFSGRPVADLVKQRIHATEVGRMPPAARLSDADLKTLDAWIDGGMEESDDTCTGDAPPPATKPFVCPAPGKVTTMKASKPFAWTDNSDLDQYVCFGVDEQVGSKRHAIAMGPMIENLQIVHHVLLFQAPEAMSNEPVKCGAAAAGSWKMVTGWAPGGGNFELPQEAGFPVEGTVHWVLQVHYNNAKNAPNQTDNSGYQLCETTQLRQNDAGILAFGSMDFNIPPRSTTTVVCDYKLDDKYAGVKFFGASPHMHNLGTSISTERLVGGTGSPQMIFKQEPFSFENQENFKLDHKQVAPGDVMRTRCTWKNPGDTTVKFGEGTGDEMCFNFLAYYPAIPDMTIGPLPVQSWVSPSLSLPLLGGPTCRTQ